MAHIRRGGSFKYAPHEHAQHACHRVLSVACPCFLTVADMKGDVGATHGLFPPITMHQDVLCEHIAPWDKGDKNNNHQAGFYIFCHRRIYLVGGP